MIGARLRQARLMAGLTQKQLAQRLGEFGCPTTAAAISKIERGERSPDATVLVAAVRALDVSPSYLTHEPKRRVEWLDYRKGSKLGKREREIIQAYASDIAELQLEIQSLLYPDARRELPKYEVTTLAEAEAAADKLRKIWDLGDRPLDCLVQVVEDRDVIVVAWEDDSEKFDGLSGYCGGHPVTVINTKRSADRIRFTLAHEIGHLVMDTGSASEAEVERLAHGFGAALLAPAEHARRELGERRSHLDWQELELLKRKYGLSMAAWVRRAYDLAIIDEGCYRDMNIDMSARGWRQCEPVSYQGDEEPMKLRQLAKRAILDGLANYESFESVGLDWFGADPPLVAESGYPTASGLLAMDQSTRDGWMTKMHRWAEDEEFEIFDAFGEEYF